ncbi:MAG TPA: hypothetical protein VKY62_10805 [Devosia sp.]|nr:hypothetical protein [Devosia sp.]
MYIAPRPTFDDDPLFAVRLAIVPIASFAIGMMVQSPMAMLYPTLAVSLVAGHRKALSIGRALAAPVLLGGMMWVMSFFVEMLSGLPGLLFAFMALICFLGFVVIQKTGNSFGMLLIVSILLMAIMGANSYTTMAYLRSEMFKAALTAGLLTPIAYVLLPPRATQEFVEIHVPVRDELIAKRALIRTVVLMAFTALLLSVLDPSNLILSIGAMFALIYPYTDQVWREARERSVSTLGGGIMALILLWLLGLSAHITVLFGVTALFLLWLGHKMMVGRLSPMTYQYAGSVMVSLAGSALMTSEPSFAFIQRVVLTVGGGVGAALAVAILESLLLNPAPQADAPVLAR